MLLPLLLGVGNTRPASGEFADIHADMGSAAAQGVSAMRKLGGVILLCAGWVRGRSSGFCSPAYLHEVSNRKSTSWWKRSERTPAGLQI
jgi:hypothetical protein